MNFIQLTVNFTLIITEKCQLNKANIKLIFYWYEKNILYAQFKDACTEVPKSLKN